MNNPLLRSLERKSDMGQEPNEQYYVRRREFLNLDPELPAFIIAVVEDTRDIPDNDANQSWDHGEITLTLADCYRRISFDFNMYNETERANSLRKIALIAEVVDAVRRAIALEVESRNARPARTETTVAPVETKPMTLESDTRSPFFSSQVITLGL